MYFNVQIEMIYNLSLYYVPLRQADRLSAHYPSMSLISRCSSAER